MVLHVLADYSHWYHLNEDDGQCPAVEVWLLRNPEGTFAMSPKPRYHRPEVLKWRVGQVVKHKRWGYKAVIIGWDLKCKVRGSAKRLRVVMGDLLLHGH